MEGLRAPRGVKGRAERALERAAFSFDHFFVARQRNGRCAAAHIQKSPPFRGGLSVLKGNSIPNRLRTVTRRLDRGFRILHPEEAGGSRVTGTNRRVIGVDPLKVTVGGCDTEGRVRPRIEVHKADLQF